jgi:ABC-2 type transport system ATP-binding protein
LEKTLSNAPALDIRDVSKVYAHAQTSSPALQGVSLTVRGGEIVGILGLNGAGKSTLIRAALHLNRLTSGSIALFGHAGHTRGWGSRTGYLPESFDAPAHMTGREVLQYLGTLGGLSGTRLTARIDELFRLLESSDLGQKRFRTYSKGMKLRLGLAQALLNNPDLLVLDEPTDGLDPSGVRLVRQLLLQMRNQGTAVLMSSHLLSEVELIADRIVIMHAGKIVREGTPAELLPRSARHQIVVDALPEGAIRKDFARRGSRWVMEAENADVMYAKLTQLRAGGVVIASVQSFHPTLEEIFFQSLGILTDEHTPDGPSGG